MNEKQLPSSWIWLADEKIYGLDVDIEAGVLHWYDQIGCSCEDSMADQTVAHFRQRGVLPIVPELPSDILAELKALAEAITESFARRQP